MSYTFKHEFEGNECYPPVNITFEVPDNEVTTGDLLDVFEDFLAACGFGLCTLYIEEEDEDYEDPQIDNFPDTMDIPDLLTPVGPRE